ELARLGNAVAHAVNNTVQAVEVDQETAALAAEIAGALLAAKKPLVVSGTGACNVAVIQAAANVAYALKDKEKDSGLVYTVPEVNSMGLTLMAEKWLEDAFQQVA